MKNKKATVASMPVLTEINRSFYGATYALSQRAKKVSLKEDLKASFTADYQALLGLAYYLVLAPSSSMQTFNR